MANVSISRRELVLGRASTAKGKDWDNLVTIINALVTAVNELKTDFNATLTKLDADGGVTDTNYSALGAIAAASADTVVLER